MGATITAIQLIIFSMEIPKNKTICRLPRNESGADSAQTHCAKMCELVSFHFLPPDAEARCTASHFLLELTACAALSEQWNASDGQSQVLRTGKTAEPYSPGTTDLYIKLPVDLWNPWKCVTCL